MRSSRLSTRTSGFALFGYGFRPFFLFAGLYAVLAVSAWLWLYTGYGTPLSSLPPQFWHAHEMIYGFVVAAITGFLLTAVPSWTGSRGFGGRPLIVLSVLWVAGRLAFAAGAFLPTGLIALIELSLLPALIALLIPPLLRAHNRNTPLLAVLALLWLLDAAFLSGLNHADIPLARSALRLSIDLVLLLVTVIGGRIVPAFTSSALRRAGKNVDVVARPWLDRLLIALMVAVVLVDAMRPDSRTSGWLAAIAAIAHAVRLAGWRGLRTGREPIVWALHLAYAWLPVGFMLKALWQLEAVAWAMYWMHAFTMGVFGSMILAVMTRAALGHTGRPLVVSRPIALAYVLLAAAAAFRIFAPDTQLFHYPTTVVVAGALWSAAFALYLIVYAPILTRPRVDGKPG